MRKITTGLLLFASILFAGTAMAQTIDQGKKFMYYERFKSAKEVFQKLVDANPNNEEATYWLGQAEIGLENVPAAKALYQAKLAAAPNSPLVLAGMGHVELIEGKSQDARSRFETAISLSGGKSIPVLNAVGFANANPDSKNGDAAYAIAKLKQATTIKKFNDPEVWANLGDAYRKFADGTNAVLSYQSALAIDPNYVRAIYRTGRVYQTQGAAQEATFMKYYNDVIAKDPAYAPVYGTLFQYYYETNVPRAAEYLDKLLANSDDDPKACSYRASIKYAQGLFAEAISQADACIAAEGANPYINLFKIKAFAYNRLKDSIQAKASFEEYFKRQNPDKIEGGDYSAYAALLLKFPGNEARVGELVTKAVALDSIEANKVAYLKSLAAAYDEQKKFKEAGDWYNKVLGVKTNFTNVDLYNAGYAYYRASVYDSATKIFQKYADKYPADIYGYYMLGNINAAVDSTSEKGLAAPFYKKVIEIAEADLTKPAAKARLITAYKYFIGYEYNVNKDQAAALAWVDKGLAVEPADAQLLSFKEVISKNDPKKPAATAKPKATPAAKK
ncbi:MAG: tetratricopeptide repeat protein [Chitinophagaceae bacterium]|nr:MAG: tetratricopeptide repeat protein [Chitinophagaceae bacterium]